MYIIKGDQFFIEAKCLCDTLLSTKDLHSSNFLLCRIGTYRRSETSCIYLFSRRKTLRCFELLRCVASYMKVCKTQSILLCGGLKYN